MSAPSMLQPGSFADRVAVVTGGGSGIGEAIAVELARLGALVVVVGRTADRLDRVVERITAEGRRAVSAVLDVRDRDAVERLVSDVIAEHGRIDHLVNSAAGQFRVAPHELSPGGWQAVVDIVLHGTWHCTQVVGQHMIERGGGGSVLSIGSNMANQGGPDTVHSASAKAGVVAMTKSLAGAWGPHDIRLNVLVPGMTEGTAGVDILFRDEASLRAAIEGVPLARLVGRQEVADAACYLLSDYASYITGTQLVIDGGRALGRH